MASRYLSRGCATIAVAALGICAGACRDGEGVLVHALRFTGVQHIDEAGLRAALDTSPASRWPWGEKRYFNRQQFDDDLRRIEAYYHDRGFPEARVRSYDAHYAPDHRSLDLTIAITEGEPVVVAGVLYDGFEALPADHRRALERQAPVAAGHPLDRQQVENLRQLALDELRDHGYPTASVAIEQTPDPTGRRAVTVRVVAIPGPYMHFGPIEITGNKSLSNYLVRKQLTYQTGQEFRLSAIQRSQRRLYNLELFQFADVTVGDANPATNQVTTKVTLVEGKPRRVTFGVGYGTEEHARATINWRHVNFLGGARGAGVEAKWSSIDRGVRLTFSQPLVITPGMSAGASGESWFARTPAYSLHTIGGRANLVYQFTRRALGVDRGERTSLSLSLTHEYERYTVSDAAVSDLTFRPTLLGLGLNPVSGEGHGTLSAVTLEFNHSSILNVLDARQGAEVAAHLEDAARGLGGDYSYLEASVEARRFVPVGRHAVLGARVRVASIGGAGDPQTSVPFFKRYFLGGATSLRGWGRFEVAPLTPAGLPIGGFSLVESSVEARAFRGNVGGAVFLDAGNVWDRSWHWDLGDLRSDIGAGLRYQTPVGPVRVDLAWQLRPISDLAVGTAAPGAYRHWRIHFSIGQAF